MRTTETKRQREPEPVDTSGVKRVTWVGLTTNLCLSGLKLAAGLLGRSQAVVADAAHSLSDVSGEVMVLVGVRYWSAPADREHPHGHRRIETLVTIAIGGILTSIAIVLAFHALATIREEHAEPPNWIAFAAALLSIVAKEILYRWTVARGREMNSPAVVANAWHHRSDALSSVPAALAVAVAATYPPWYFVDHVGAVVVSLLILQAAWRIVRPALAALIDRGASETELARIRKVAVETPGVVEVHAVRTRYLGPALEVDLHVLVEGSISVSKGHQISEEVKKRLIEKGPDVVDVIIHIEPREDDTTE